MAATAGLYHTDNGVFLEYYSKSRRLIEDVHHLLLRFGIFSLIREKTTAIGTRACSIQITDKDQVARFAAEIGFVTGCVKQRRLDEKILPLIRAKPRRKSNFESCRWGLAAADGSRYAAGVSFNSLGINGARHQSMSYAAASAVAAATRDESLTPLVEEGPLWDCVESIAAAGEEEVYDISVPRIRNFVANDLIVHNSTYARCFSADTRVALADGTAATFDELIRRDEAGRSRAATASTARAAWWLPPWRDRGSLRGIRCWKSLSITVRPSRQHRITCSCGAMDGWWPQARCGQVIRSCRCIVKWWRARKRFISPLTGEFQDPRPHSGGAPLEAPHAPCHYGPQRECAITRWRASGSCPEPTTFTA